MDYIAVKKATENSILTKGVFKLFAKKSTEGGFAISTDERKELIKANSKYKHIANQFNSSYFAKSSICRKCSR